MPHQKNRSREDEQCESQTKATETYSIRLNMNDEQVEMEFNPTSCVARPMRFYREFRSKALRVQVAHVRPVSISSILKKVHASQMSLGMHTAWPHELPNKDPLCPHRTRTERPHRRHRTSKRHPRRAIRTRRPANYSVTQKGESG